MNTSIFYFTGTGNSLWVARSLAEALANASLISIPAALAASPVPIEADQVVIVCPIYMYRLPHIVVRFARTLRTRAPISLVVTMGGDPGDLFDVAESLFAEGGMKLTLGMAIRLPSNYIPWGGVADAETLEPVFERARGRLAEVIEALQEGRSLIERDHGWFRTRIHPGLLYKLGYRYIPVTDKSFRVESSCNGCGICEKICPVSNIAMVGGHPTWQQRCEQCLACLQWCPKEAIQVKDKTQGERRYHHPSIRVKDLIAQKTAPPSAE